jgi:hypothetical protein
LLAEALAAEMPEVEHSVATRPRNELKTLSVGNVSMRGVLLFASPDFFNVFSYDLLQGNKEQILTDKSNMVISESLALKLFNTTEVVGKIVDFDYSRQFKVAGVFKDLPGNSSDKFDFILPFELYKEFDPNVLNWNYNLIKAYVVLKEGSNLEAFNQKLEQFMTGKRNNNTSTLITRPYSDAYLYGNYENGKQSGGRIEYVLLGRRRRGRGLLPHHGCGRRRRRGLLANEGAQNRHAGERALPRRRTAGEGHGDSCHEEQRASEVHRISFSEASEAGSIGQRTRERKARGPGRVFRSAAAKPPPGPGEATPSSAGPRGRRDPRGRGCARGASAPQRVRAYTGLGGRPR